MPDTVFHIPAKVVFGTDSVSRLGAVAAEYADRVLLVSESALHHGRQIERVREILGRKGIDAIISDDLIPGAVDTVVTELISTARAGHVQAVIGLGGMSVLAAARCAAVAAGAGLSVKDLYQASVPAGKRLPFIAVPTALRDHFLFSPTGVVVDGSEKTARTVHTPVETTCAVVMDPRLSVSLSPKATGAAILDILAASIEGFVSKKSSFVSDTLLLDAVRIASEAARDTAKSPSDLRGRTHACEAGLLSAMGLAISSQGPIGAFAYAVNSRYGIPKSWIAAILLPYVLEYLIPSRTAKLAQIAEALGESVQHISAAEDAALAPEAVRRLLGRLGISSRLRDFDLNTDDLYDLAENACSLEMTASCPVAMSAQDLYDIIKPAY
jgi:alcohol dehydrogenase class IV